MNSLPTRFFCAMLSMVGTAGLVAFSTPAVAVGGQVARPAATAVAIAAASAPAFRHG